MKHVFRRTTILGLTFCGMVKVLYAQPDTISLAQTTWAERLYDAAIVEQTAEHSGTALRLLQLSFALQPSSVAANTLGMILPRGNEDATLFWLQKAFDLAPEESENAKALFFFYTAINQTPKSITVLERHLQHNPRNEEACLYLASAYAETGELEKAVKLVGDLPSHARESSTRKSAAGLMAQILKAQGKSDAAKAQIAKTFNPNEKDPDKLLANVLELSAIGGQKEALELIEKSPIKLTDDERIAEIKASLHIALGDTPAAVKEATHIASIPHLTPEERAEIIIRIISSDHTSEKAYKEYRPALEKLSKSNPSSYDAQEAYLAILRSEPPTEEYLKQLRMMVKAFPDKEALQATLMGDYINLEDFARADSVGEAALKHAPGNLRVYYMMGVVAMMREKEEEAIKIFQEALKHAPEGFDPANKAALGTIYGVLGDIFYGRKEVEKAFEYYEKALQLDEKNPGLLNNYAYFLGQERRDLKKALDMARQANELAPNDPTILDTYAFLLMLNKNFTLAEIYIRNAIEVGGEKKAPLYDRYAEILLAQEKRKEALEAMRKAQKLSPKEERARKISELERKP